MKHRGPGASRNPARESARTTARATTPRRPSGGSSPVLAVGDWLLRQDDTGALVAFHMPTGTTVPLAQPPTTRPEGS